MFEHFNTSVTAKSKGRSVGGSISLLDKSTKQLISMYGDLKLDIPGYGVDFVHQLEQQNTARNNFVSKMELQLGRSKKHSIVSVYEDKEASSSITSTVDILSVSPFTVGAEFGFKEAMMMAVAFEQDGKKYSGLVRASDNENTNKLNLEVKIPGKQAQAELMGTILDHLYSVDTQFTWTLDGLPKQAYGLKGWVEPPSMSMFNGSLTTIMPERTLEFKLIHKLKEQKYICHTEFTWEPKKTITLDTVSFFTPSSIDVAFQFTSPFKDYSTLKADLNHRSDDEEYNCKVTVSGDSTMSLEAVVKKPINLKTLVATLQVRTSFPQVKNINVFINHKMSASVASAAKFRWNKQFFNTEVVMQNLTKGIKTAYSGSVDVQTSHSSFKTGTLSFKHDSNGETYSSMVSLLRNRKEYKVDSTVTHKVTNKRVDNSGSIDFSHPSDKGSLSWNHMHTENTIASTITGKSENAGQVFARLSGDNKDIIKAGLDVQSSITGLPKYLLNSSFSYTSQEINTAVLATEDGQKLMASDFTYTLKRPTFLTSLTLSIPKLNVDSRLSVGAALHNDNNELFRAHMIANISPEMFARLTYDQTFFTDSHVWHTQVDWESSLQTAEQVKYTYEVFEEDKGLNTVTTIQFSQDKVIKMTSKFSVEKDSYHISGEITTPFASFSSMKGGITFDGTLDAFKVDADLEIQPYLSLTKASLTYDATDNIAALLRLDIPIPEHPYLIVDVGYIHSKMHVEVTYSPTDSIRFDLTRSLRNIMEFEANLRSPFGTAAASLEGHISDLHANAKLEISTDKKYAADIVYSTTDKIEGTVTITIPSKRDIVLFVSHSGLATDFQTRAEIKHNRKNHFESDLTFKLTGDSLTLYSTGTLKSEYLQDDYASTLSLQGTAASATLYGDFTADTFGKSSIDASVGLSGAYEGKMTLQSALIQPISVSFSHSKPGKYIQTKADLMHGGQKKFDLDATLGWIDSVTAELSLKSILIDDIDMKLRIDGGMDKFIAVSSASYGLHRASLDISQSVNLPTQLKQKITAHISGFEEITSDLSFEWNNNALDSYIEETIGKDIHRLDVKYNNIQSIHEGTLSMASTLFNPVSIKMQLEQYSVHGELSIGKDTSIADMRLVHNPLHASIHLTSPYQVQEVLLSTDLQDDAADVHAKVTLNGKKNNEAKLRLSKQNNMYVGSLEAKSMFTDDITASLSIKNNKKQQKVDLEASYKYGHLQSASTASLSFRDSYKGELKVVSHLISSLTGSFDLEFNEKSLNVEAQYKYGQNTSEAKLFLNCVGKYEGLVSLKSHLTPDMSAGFGFSGTWNDSFSSHAEYVFGKNKTSANIEVKNKEPFLVSADLRLLNREPISLSYSLNRHPYFNSSLTLTVSPIEPLQAQVAYSPNAFILVKLANNLLNISRESGAESEIITCNFLSDDVSLDYTFNHKTSPGSTVCHSKLNFKAGTAFVTKDAIFTTSSNKFQANLKLASRQDIFEAYPSEVDSEIDVAVNKSKIDASGFINVDGAKSEGKLKANVLLEASKVTLDGLLQLSSPDRQGIDSHFQFRLSPLWSDGWIKFDDRTWMKFGHDIEDINNRLRLELRIFDPNFSIFFIQNNTYGDWRGQMEVIVGKDKDEKKWVAFTFTSKSKGELDGWLDMPNVQRLRFGVVGYNKIFSGTSEFYVSTDGMKNIGKLGISVERENGLKISLHPDIPDVIIGKFELDYQTRELKSNWEIKVAEELYTGDIHLVCSSGYYKGDVSIEMVDFGTLLNFEYSQPSAMITSQVKAGEQVWKGVGSITKHGAGTFKADFQLDLPDKDPINFKLENTRQANDNKLIAELRCETNYAAALLLTTQEMIISYDNPYEPIKLHVVSNGGNAWSAELIKSEKSVILVSFTEVPIAFTLKVPSADINVEVQLYDTKTKTSYKGGVSIVYAVGEKIQIDIEQSTKGKSTESKLTVFSPFTNTITMMAAHSSVSGLKTAQYTLSSGADKVNLRNTYMSKPQSISITHVLESSFEGKTYEHSLVIGHKGTLDNFRTDVTLKQGSEEVKLDFNFKIEDTSLDTEAHVTTSFEGYESVKASVKCDLSPLTSRIEFSWPGVYELTNQMDMTMAPMSANWELKTPEDTYYINLKSSKTSNSITGDITASGFGRKHTASLVASKLPLSLTITADELPVVKFVLRKERQGLYTTDAEISWNSSAKIEVDGALDIEQYDMRLSLKTPFETIKMASAEASHKALMKSMTETVRVVYNDKPVVDVSFDHSLISPQKHMLFTAKAPLPMSLKLDGDFTLECVDLDVRAMLDSAYLLTVEGGYDFRKDYKADLKLKGLGNNLTFEAFTGGRQSRMKAVYGDQVTGYQVMWSDDGAVLELTVPGYASGDDHNRNIIVSGSNRGSVTKGQIEWDKDVDATKKISLTIMLPETKDNTHKSTVTLSMPFINKV